MPTDETLRAHLLGAIMRQVSRDQERRSEALRDFIVLSVPDMDAATASRLAELVPPLMPALYERWARLFLERLFETVPRPQIEDLCGGTPENDATALLVFVMFLESERMEKQMAADLAAYGLTQSDAPDQGQVVAAALRAHLGPKPRTIQ
jgi:hypothetical protein